MSKVIVVTGASSGIGAATGQLLASKGHAVVLVARRKGALDTVGAECGGRAHVSVADVTRRDEVRRVVREAVDTFGRIDVWINNAGRGITRAPSQLTDQDVDDMMTVNVKSALYGVQEVLPHFISRGEGHIINISSMLGRMPLATMRSAYCGAKHFLNALTYTLRDELKQAHPTIAISLVSPGVVYTDFGNNAVHGGADSRQLPYGQTPEDVASVIAGVVDSRAEDVYTRTGAREQVIKYFSEHGSDPEAGGADGGGR
ncbi:MAG TPA: SDR family oxidoreductase [Vicinamibacterales bacterium]